jgi:hypothetical protein
MNAAFRVLLRGWVGCVVFFLARNACAGPYSAGMNDPTNIYDAPIPGFVGPDGIGGAKLPDGLGGTMNPDNYVNPLFFDWASSVFNYSPAPGVGGSFSNSSLALGPVTGNYLDVVSLGDLNSSQIGTVQPGTLTLFFSHPIRNLDGADFVIYENSFISTTSGVGKGGVFADLAYVEVSSDGVNWVRFPSTSLTGSPVGAFGTIDPTNVNNLVGKHVNSNGACWGTPFDLSQVGMSSISYIRIVDIPGSGFFKDSLGSPIYDAWVTIGSGGADIEAVGAISRLVTFSDWTGLHNLTGANAGATADPDGDGVSNLLEYAFGRQPDHVEPSAALTKASVQGGRLMITFTRDERASDLLYEVQVADTLQPANWTTVAQSSGGGATAGTNGFSPAIAETSASAIASIGVLRQVNVTDVVSMAGHAQRFMRVKVTKQ